MKTPVSVAVDVERTARVQQVESLMDMPVVQRAERTWTADLPIEDEPWNVGLIVGPSGAGKTRIARALFPDRIVDGLEWDEHRSVIDGFPQEMPIKEVIKALTSVGFNSAPAWVRPFQSLSTGEQFRATLARAIAEAGDDDVTVIDEFTSTIDRQVAKVASSAVGKAVRRSGKKLIALSCHYDIVDWLQPDWIYQPHLAEFTGRSLLRGERPPIQLDLHPVARSLWPAFAPHHYLSSKLHPNAFCLGGFVDGECVAFYSYTHFPHPKRRNIMKGHRLVVLPDWQGVGIGGVMADWLGQYLYERGWRFHRTIAHPAVIAHCQRSPRWSQVQTGMQIGRQGKKSDGLQQRTAHARLLNTRSFVYVAPVGTPRPTSMRDPSPLDRQGLRTLSQMRSAPR